LIKPVIIETDISQYMRYVGFFMSLELL